MHGLLNDTFVRQPPKRLSLDNSTDGRTFSTSKETGHDTLDSNIEEERNLETRSVEDILLAQQMQHNDDSTEDEEYYWSDDT